MSTQCSRLFSLSILLLVIGAGCDKPAPIETYVVPTKVPEQFQVGKERMLAAMVPSGDQVWFFKVTGPEQTLESIESEFRGFVEKIQIEEGEPLLKSLPAGWKLGGEKPMRFASIDVDTPNKQLDISVSSLGRLEDWDAMVKMNVNRWRGQLGLDKSEEKWAQGEALSVAAADGDSVWVDLVGEPTASGSGPSGSMPPFVGGNPSGVPPMVPPRGSKKGTDATEDPRLKFDRPPGWRDGKMSSMRMAAFNVGPEDAQAELTVIPAGGDLRGNVARWLGQVRAGKAPDEVVDKALADSIKLEIDGRSAERFFLTAEDPEQGTAIDATIVPLEGGMSLFIKMTGPAETVASQSEAIASFLDSLKLNLQ